MKYEVVAGLGTANQVVAVKNCMDDALDVIRDMEEFDRAEGFKRIDYYKVRIVKDSTT